MSIPPGAVTEALKSPFWRKYIYEVVGRRIGSYGRYFDEICQVSPLPEDDGVLLASIDDRPKRTVPAVAAISVAENGESRRLFLLNGNLNHDTDIEGTLRSIYGRVGRGDRVSLVLYNFYLAWIYKVANRVGLRRGTLPSTFVTETTLSNLTRLAGFEIVSLEYVCHFPARLLGLGNLLNRLFSILPVIRKMSLVCVATIRPIVPLAKRPSLAIVIPARNEKGNIEAALRRLPDLGCEVEVIFVEGHSSDGTWEEIQRVSAAHGRSDIRVSSFRQPGKGKNDAVQVGFRAAKSEILTILDADLTMPPEMLPRFYEAYCAGLGDFINGNRLVYPMEGEAMRPLNRIGNIFFAKALAWSLKAPIGDSLCGTKMVAKRDWERFNDWKKDFGDFDPFGDFDLIFPAQVLGLGIVDLPIRYLDRTYGTTNISRFKHGFMLLRMTWIGFRKIRWGWL